MIWVLLQFQSVATRGLCFLSSPDTYTLHSAGSRWHWFRCSFPPLHVFRFFILRFESTTRKVLERFWIQLQYGDWDLWDAGRSITPIYRYVLDHTTTCRLLCQGCRFVGYVDSWIMMHLVYFNLKWVTEEHQIIQVTSDLYWSSALTPSRPVTRTDTCRSLGNLKLEIDGMTGALEAGTRLLNSVSVALLLLLPS